MYGKTNKVMDQGADLEYEKYTKKCEFVEYLRVLPWLKVARQVCKKKPG